MPGFAWPHKFPSLRTQEIDQGKKISKVGPLQALRCLDWKNSTVFPDFNAQTWNPLAFLADLSAAYSFHWTGTGPVCHKHGVAHLPLGLTTYRAGTQVAPTGNSGEITAALIESGVHLTAPDDVVCFHLSVITWAEQLCPQGKPLPVCSTWYLGKCGCASRTTICSPLPVAQWAGRGVRHTQ